MGKVTGVLKNWYKVHYGDIYVIVGNVYEDIHGRFRNGQIITTSMVKKIKDNKAYTLNSIYELENEKE